MPESTIDPALAHAGKRDRLEGAALENADVLASTNTVFAASRPQTGTLGLQQYFTPAEATALVTRVLRLRRYLVCDLTAGNGALLAGVPEKQRFGVEIDADQVKDGTYTAIRGDLQHVYPLLRVAQLDFQRIVCNPPFSLTWNDGTRKVNSTLLTFRYALSLLSDQGLGALIAGRKRFNELVLGDDDARAVRVVIDVDDVFDFPCVIAFFCRPEAARKDPLRLSASRADLSQDGFVATIAGELDSRTTAYPTGYGPGGVLASASDMAKAFAAVQLEYDRRVEGRALRQPYDVMVQQGQLSVRLSPFALLALQHADPKERQAIAALDRQSASYFALNLREWHTVQRHERDGVITVDPAARAHIEDTIEAGRLMLRPMYPIPETMRLGFLDDLDQIRCRVSDPEYGFVAGSWYALTVASRIVTNTVDRVVEVKEGPPELRRFEQDRKLLRITIDRHEFDEAPRNIRYITEHFDVPDPGDLATNHPEKVAEARRTLLAIAVENGVTLDDWQVEDLARCVVKERTVLAWSMGGGKTLGQLYFAEACIRLGKAANRALFVAPQDLHPQWQRECQKFLASTGRTLESIQTPADAERVRRHLKRGGEGWYITHYEALSLIGTSKDTRLPIVNVYPGGGSDMAHRRAVRAVDRLNQVAFAEHDRAVDEWEALPEEERAWDPPPRPDAIEGPRRPLTSELVCPGCAARGRTTFIGEGWTGRGCSRCGYAHFAVRVKNIGSRLSTVFATGVICIDELSMIRGDKARRSLAVRGLRAACRLGGSGTPISNYINDCFWGFAWCIGWGSVRFPYSYEEGKPKFENDFCVLEYRMSEDTSGELTLRGHKKVLPEVTNLSMLWKLLCINMVRRRQRDMGEMVPRTFHTIEVPMGVAQREANAMWLNTFPKFFEEKYPDHDLVTKGLVELFQATLGLLWKLEYAATLPEQDPDRSWHEVDVSNFTPKFVKALEIIEQHVAAGEKVLVGSCLVDTGPLVCALLQQRGIRARHITEQRGGKATTKNPRARAKEVTDFIVGTTQVLCAGVQAMKLGHNLDVASVVVLIGYPWSYEAFDQFLARVWRRTSKKPVSVYCLTVKGSLDVRKLKLLTDKAAASDVALDGRLIEEPEKPTNWNAVLRDMKAAGVPVVGDEIDESALQEFWRTREHAVVARGPSPSPAWWTDATTDHVVVELGTFEVEGDESNQSQRGLFVVPGVAPTEPRPRRRRRR